MEVINPLFSSQIYPYLQQFLLEIGGCQKSGLSSETLFALVFNLCRRAATEQNIVEKQTSRYIDELKHNSGSSRETELVLCLTWVVLMVQEKPSHAVNTFSQQLQSQIRHASIYNKARQLAITIRQKERHIKTDFFITSKDIPVMKVEIEGNPGTGNSFTENTYHINKVETLAPNATQVINKHYHFDGKTNKEDVDNVTEQMEEEDQKSESHKLTKDVLDTEVVRDEILTFVSRVRPLLDDAWKADYQNIWKDILNMQEVKEKIYDPGKQKKTNFNQYLVGNILYYMFEDCGACSDDKEYNASEVCMKLIGTTEHQLRKELSKLPPEDIKARLHTYFTKKFQL